jgi:putative ABC transport system substrate-binding protein
MEPVRVQPASPLDAAFESMNTKRAEAVFIQGTLVRKDAVDLALRHRLPSLSPSVALPRLGGLTSYSAGRNFHEIAAYIDKLLKGAKPADLPVSFPTKFELIVNLKTAKALGITMPPTLLTRADEVIE